MSEKTGPDLMTGRSISLQTKWLNWALGELPGRYVADCPTKNRHHNYAVNAAFPSNSTGLRLSFAEGLIFLL